MRAILFGETGTLGVRTWPVTKRALDREVIRVDTGHGPIGVKVGYVDGQPATVAPEYDDCARAARAARVPVRRIYEEARRLAEQEISRSRAGDYLITK
jgi:uncharacterized protein (DUF111 family)